MKRVPQIFLALLFTGILSTSNPLQAEDANFSTISGGNTEVATMQKDVRRILSKNVIWQANSLHFSTEILISNIYYNYKSILYKQNRENDRADQFSVEEELVNTTE